MGYLKESEKAQVFIRGGGNGGEAGFEILKGLENPVRPLWVASSGSVEAMVRVRVAFGMITHSVSNRSVIRKASEG